MPDEGRVQVLGTAHVSEESVQDVEEAVEDGDHDIVAVELDEGRYRQLQGETPDDIDASDLLEGNTVFQFLAYWMLSYVQARLGDRFDVQPGADMLAAVEAAEEHGIEVALVDRDIQETIRRFWSRMTVLEKLRMVGSLAFGVTDPRIAGVTFGLVFGLIVGPLLGLFGGAVGVTEALLTRAAGGALLAIAVGYVTLAIVDQLAAGAGGPSEETALVVAVGAAVAAGGIGGVGLGLLDGPVETYLGGFIAQSLGGLAIGIVAGLVVGLAVALVMTLLGVEVAPEEEGEAFDPAELTDEDVVTAMMEEFRAFSPGGASALIDERDAYIAHRLVDLRAAGHDVLAVVGAGHRAGVESYLNNPESLPPMTELTGDDDGGIPWGTVIGALIGVAFLSSFLLLGLAGVGQPALVRLFVAWVVINGILAGGLAKLMGARWPSAAAGGAIAWFSSVDPTLAPGWIAGYVELRYTTVNVSDIGRLNELLSNEETPIRALIGQLFDVPLFRLIMVVAGTNVGSIVGTLLFFAYVLPAFGAELGGPEALLGEMLRGARRAADIVVGVL